MTNFKEIVKAYSKPPIAVFPIYIELTDSYAGAILLAQIIYWESTMNGEFYKTNEDWQKDLYFSESELETAKRKISKYITIVKKGLPARNHYTVNWNVLEADIMANNQAKLDETPKKPLFIQSPHFLPPLVTPLSTPTINTEITQRMASPSSFVGNEEEDGFSEEEKTVNNNLGFPLPDGWEDQSYIESDNNRVFLFYNDGQKVKQGEINRLRREWETQQKRKKTIANKEKAPSSRPIIQQIAKKWIEICKKEVGITPVMIGKDYGIIQFALGKGGLTEKQIYDLFEEWFGLGKPDDEAVGITRALSGNQINSYKARNQIK